MAYRAIWRAPEHARRALWQAAGYEPSPEQAAAHLDPSRARLVAGGERAGKSRWTGQEVHDWCWASKDGEIWIVGPTYDLARGDFLHALTVAGATGILLPGSVSTPAQGQCQFTTVTGVRVVTRTSKDPETLASIAPIGIAMAEAAQQSLEVYLRLRGRVAERRGPMVLSGTFEGSLGWYPELWTRWQAANPDEGRSFSIPSWANRTIYPGGRQDPEILGLERITPADLFMERYGAIPCKPATLVFKEFGYLTHVRELSFNPAWPVQLWIDPGYAGAYAVLAVQFDRSTIPATVRHFDEVYEHGVVSADIIEMCKAREWWPSVRQVVMDVAGRQHHAQESHYETWRRLAGLVPMGQPVGIANVPQGTT